MQEIVDQVLEVRGAHRLGGEQPRPPTPLSPSPMRVLWRRRGWLIGGGSRRVQRLRVLGQRGWGPMASPPPCLTTQEDFDSEQLSVLASCLQELFKAHFRGEVLPEEVTEE